jgi:hypothetical protein
MVEKETIGTVLVGAAIGFVAGLIVKSVMDGEGPTNFLNGEIEKE